MLLFWSEKMIEQESDRQTGAKYQQEKYKPKNIGLKHLTMDQEALIRQRVARLPRAERLAVYVHFWENSSISDIAASLGVPATLAKKLINNALARLGGELQGSVRFFVSKQVRHEKVASEKETKYEDRNGNN